MQSHVIHIHTYIYILQIHTYHLFEAAQEWNKEYEQAGEDVKESLSGWAKQQEAALAEDQDESGLLLRNFK